MVGLLLAGIAHGLSEIFAMATAERSWPAISVNSSSDRANIRPSVAANVDPAANQRLVWSALQSEMHALDVHWLYCDEY